MSRRQFLSTPSARRATRCAQPRAHAGIHFYPRPPRGGRLLSTRILASSVMISIHALREEGDLHKVLPTLSLVISIHALREEGDDHPGLLSRGVDISIHALREEGDQLWGGRTRPLRDFYPRPPRGGRQWKKDNLPTRQEFLSTPSARRATTVAADTSIFPYDFYPRPPRGGRRRTGRYAGYSAEISIHALREEGDQPSFLLAGEQVISIHALREEGDRWHCGRSYRA